MPVQELTNEQKAQLLLQGCLYREQGKDMSYRLKPGVVGYEAWRDDPYFGDNLEGRALLNEQRDYLTVCRSIHSRFFAVEIPLESIEIIN